MIAEIEAMKRLTVILVFLLSTFIFAQSHIDSQIRSKVSQLSHLANQTNALLYMTNVEKQILLSDINSAIRGLKGTNIPGGGCRYFETISPKEIYEIGIFDGVG